MATGKVDIIKLVSRDTGYTIAKAKAIIEDFLEKTKKEVSKNNEIGIMNFGVFKKKTKKRHEKTMTHTFKKVGDKMKRVKLKKAKTYKIPTKYTLVFKPSKNFFTKGLAGEDKIRIPKTELIKKIAKNTKNTQKTTREVLNKFFDMISERTDSLHRVTITEFGIFNKKRIKARTRTVYNFQTERTNQKRSAGRDSVSFKGSKNALI